MSDPEKAAQPRFPSSIGACIDALYDARELRLARARQMEAELEALKLQERELEDHILNSCKREELESVRGKRATGTRTVSVVPTIDDWAAFARYVVKTGETDLLRKQLAVEAVRERWEAQKAIPGVGKFEKVSLSLTKASARGARHPRTAQEPAAGRGGKRVGRKKD